MTRDEIYEHLAQVYLGKQKFNKKKKRPFNIKLLANAAIILVIAASTFYGLTAFLSRKSDELPRRVIFALSNSPIRIKYNFNYPHPQVQDFSISIPKIDVLRYNKISFSIRGTEEGYPAIVKVVLKNKRNESSFYFVEDVRLKWQKLDIPLAEFDKITDWTSLKDISFILEAWNVEKKKGAVLIDDICLAADDNAKEIKKGDDR